METEFSRFTRAVATTPWRDVSDAVELARQLADFFDIPYAPRRNRSVLRLLDEEACDVVVVADREPKLFHREAPEEPMFFHPGMARQRIARINRGQSDRLIELCGIQPGDRVIDATLGLGTDSLVFACAVGATGHVTALEQVPLIYHLVRYAQATGAPAYPGIGRYLARIDLQLGDHTAYLSTLPDGAADIVYFDPMFAVPAQSAGIEPLRPFANYGAVSERAFAEACRVARRAVVIKERPLSGVFERLGVTPDQPRRRFAYGVWRREGWK